MQSLWAFIRERINIILTSVTEVDTQCILFLVIVTYSLPLIGIAYSAYMTDGFVISGKSVYIASAISAINSSHLRDIFGSMLVPLVTTFSIKLSGSNQKHKVPLGTAILFATFIALFIASSVLYGIIVSNEKNLKDFGENIFTSFKDITSANMKETLIDVAMTIGITVKKQ